MLSSSFTGKLLEAGCDEAGRGCLAGPVYAAAVIFPPAYSNPRLNDSKKLTARQRDELRVIIESEALSWAVTWVDQWMIDQVNILNASILAMHKALDKLTVRPQFILIDGNRFHPYQQISHQCIVKGDGLYLSIAAASILAKTYRDEYMKEIDLVFPQYGWKTNKGYPTQAHRHAIRQWGITHFHRKTFNMGKQLHLFQHNNQ